MDRSVCSADWQSAVSRVGNPLVVPIHSRARRLPIGETADCQSALLHGHGAHRIEVLRRGDWDKLLIDPLACQFGNGLR